MSVTTHWGGDVTGGIGGYWGIYLPPPEHGITIHCDLSYHGPVSGSGAEAGNAPIQEMVGAALPGYPGDKSEACCSKGGGETGTEES